MKTITKYFYCRSTDYYVKVVLRREEVIGYFGMKPGFSFHDMAYMNINKRLVDENVRTKHWIKISKYEAALRF